MLPEVRTALRGEVTAKTDEGKTKQKAGFDALRERVKPAKDGAVAEVLDLYEFLPTRRTAKENKAALAAKAACDALVEAIVRKLVVAGKTEAEARALACV